jgi:hypothetical protein
MTGPNVPYTGLDADQVLRQSFDESEDRLRVDAQVTATIAVLEVDISAADGDNIAISDGVKNVTISTEGAKNALDVKLAGDTVVQIEDSQGNAIESTDGALHVLLQNTELEINLDAATDSVAIGDGTNLLSVNANGSINVEGPLTDAELRASPISTTISGTVTTNGLTDAELRASPVPVSSDALTDAELRAFPISVTGSVSTGGLTNAELRASPVDVNLSGEPIKISGTENGQPGGPEFTFVNNIRSQILAGKDRQQDITYADFGTKNQRITQITYTAPSIGSGPGYTAIKTFSYTLVSNRYRRDSIDWTIT